MVDGSATLLDFDTAQSVVLTDYSEWIQTTAPTNFGEKEKRSGHGAKDESNNWNGGSEIINLSGQPLIMGIAIESPQYTVVHSESDFEIRFYTKSTWMSAPVDDPSFEKATKMGFHRLFQYIQGANLNWSRIAMTAPVLTSIVPGAGPLHSSSYLVQLYLPVKFQATPPLPLPELKLKPYGWEAHCVAVRKFSGFAKDEKVIKEAEKLATSLSKFPSAKPTSEKGYAYAIAQYNSPFRLIGRVNEVWVDVDAADLDGCKSSAIAAF